MAAILNLTFPSQTFNASTQVGDNIYYSCNLPKDGGFYTTSTPRFLGKITKMTTIKDPTNVEHTVIKVLDKAFPRADLMGGSDGVEFGAGCPDPYFSFSKSGIVNQNELLGYYSQVQFVNNSEIGAELFSVGTIITENSK